MKMPFARSRHKATPRRIMSKLTFPIFTDPRYHTEANIEIETSQIVAVEEKLIKLFMAGKHRATQVTLRNGATHLLRGHIASQIERAQNLPKLQ